MSDPLATLSTRAPTGGNRLADLRARIAQVTRRRSRMRLISGLSRLLLAILIALAVIFLIDWMVSPGRLVRGLLLVGAAVAVGRVYWRRVRPGLAQRESELDIALAIEKRQGIDSDLVAALEFAEARPAGSGSADLRDAVIDYVADFGRSWEMPREAADPKLRRRAAWLASALAGIAFAGVMRPDFAAAFLNRLFLGSAHYPTRTRIESLAIGGTSVDLTPGASAEVKSPLGREVGFTVGIGGEQPRIVRMRLKSPTTGNTTEIELLPDVAAAPTFAARLPKLAESVQAQVFAGDDWTDPVRVVAIAPPLIDLAITATPPAYAAGTGERPAVGARQVTVLEGSEVGIAVRCTNKNLASATLVVDAAEHPLRPTGSAAGGLAADWEIAAADSPLARLDKTVAFELRVVDEDGLGADMPLVGSIRVKPDAPPRVTADMQTRLVLPTAVPRLTWRVADDHAVSRVVVVAEVVAGRDSQAGEQWPRTLTLPAELPAGAAGWVGRERLPLEGSVQVKLDPLGLQVGDQVRLTVRAADYRGAADGREAQSEPIMIEVTDERGILAALTETDERSVQQLDAIIDRELTVGGAK
jgi:hypothetical protein